MAVLTPPQHGGDLQRAMACYGGDAADWLDCSTGIAPYAYPLPAVPTEVWQRLPEQDTALLAAASRYYGTEQLLALPGSQAAIALLPQLRPRCRVGIVSPAYAEHAWQWQQHGHAVREIPLAAVDAALPELDVLVLVNPNNPTAQQLSVAPLLAWHAQLAAHGGWLLVDEAFADLAPQHSLLPHAGLPGLVVLRSLGKFFGLAGARLGFVAAEPALLQALQQGLGPWAVSAPAQWAGTMALADGNWQRLQAERLRADSAWLHGALSQVGLQPLASMPLLHWCPTLLAAEWQAALAQARLWCRRFTIPSGLRFGPVAQHQREHFLQCLAAAQAQMQASYPTRMEQP